MTRFDLVKHLLHQARGNGFELRRWFRQEAALPWPGGDAAVEWLCQGSRVNLLLCSPNFAECFYGGPERLRHVQPATVFQRPAANGVTRTVTRRAHPRTSRYDHVWRYHLQHMMVSPEPLRYAQRFLVAAETLQQAPPKESGILKPVLQEPDYDDELLVRDLL